MDHRRLKHCLKLFDWNLSDRPRKRTTQAKALGKSERTITRYRRLIEVAQARGPRPLLAAKDWRRGSGRQQRSGGVLSKARPAVGKHLDLQRLARCAKVLELEYSGTSTTVTALADEFRVDERTTYRDLELIEQAIGRPLTLVRRRAKRKN